MNGFERIHAQRDRGRRRPAGGWFLAAGFICFFKRVCKRFCESLQDLASSSPQSMSGLMLEIPACIQ